MWERMRRGGMMDRRGRERRESMVDGGVWS
jgi:hypothetical protein